MTPNPAPGKRTEQVHAGAPQLRGAELVGMSGGGSETAVGCEATPSGGDKKRDSLGTAGSPAHLIIKGTEF